MRGFKVPLGPDEAVLKLKIGDNSDEHKSSEIITRFTVTSRS